MSMWACTNLWQCLDKLALLKNKVAVAQINEGHLEVENYSVNKQQSWNPEVGFRACIFNLMIIIRLIILKSGQNKC